MNAENRGVVHGLRSPYQTGCTGLLEIPLESNNNKSPWINDPRSSAGCNLLMYPPETGLSFQAYCTLPVPVIDLLQSDCHSNE